MTAVLKFDLDDSDDRNRFLRCVHADDVCRALWEIQEMLRCMTRNAEADGLTGEVALDTIREQVYDIISDVATAAMEAYR